MNTTLPKHISDEFRKHFLIERVTKIEVSDETSFTYVAQPLDLKGHEASEALGQWFATTLETEVQKAVETEREKLLVGILNLFPASDSPEGTMGELLKNSLSHNKEEV